MNEPTDAQDYVTRFLKPSPTYAFCDQIEIHFGVVYARLSGQQSWVTLYPYESPFVEEFVKKGIAFRQQMANGNADA